MPDVLVALAERLQEICLRRRLTVALAESCTGGLIATTITDVAGSSGYFLGGVVSYSNEAKEALLAVPRPTLDRHGAASHQVAAAMAEGARAAFGASIAASVTGVAGPDGGTERKPVGLVFLGLAMADGTAQRRHHFEGPRREIREQAARAALAWLIERAEAGTALR